MLPRLLKKAHNASRAIVDPRYRYLYRQRSVNDYAVREQRADRLAAGLPKFPVGKNETAFALERDGIAFLDSLISPQAVAELRDYMTGAPAEDPYRPHHGTFSAPDQVPADTHVAFIPNEYVAAAPHVLELANHPEVLAAAAAHLGCKPTISYMTSWWSSPSRSEAEEAELFHRDRDDYRFVKLFLYLTDVDEESGPHAYVRGSHRSAKLLDRRRYTEDEIAAAFPAEDVLSITGKAGSHFLENTFGMHRGIPPKSKQRLIFQVLYSMMPHISGPAHPVHRLGHDRAKMLDPYINRVYYSFG